MMRIPTDRWKDEPLTKEMIEELHKKLKKQREEEEIKKIQQRNKDWMDHCTSDN